METEENQKNSRTDEIRIGNENKRIARHTDGFFPYLVSSFKQHFSNTLCRAIQAREDFKKIIKAVDLKFNIIFHSAAANPRSAH